MLNDQPEGLFGRRGIAKSNHITAATSGLPPSSLNFGPKTPDYKTSQHGIVAELCLDRGPADPSLV